MEEKLKQLTFGKTMIIGLVLTVGYYFSLYDDGAVLENQIQTTRADFDKNTQELESLKKAIIDAERFKQTMATLGAEMDRVLLAIPAKLTSLDLMKIVSTEAKSIGANIVSLTSSQANNSTNQASNFYEPVPIEISISGSYTQTMLFLSNLTRLDKIIVARKLNLSTDPGAKTDGNGSNMNLKVSLEAFRYLSGADQATSGSGGQ